MIAAVATYTVSNVDDGRTLAALLRGQLSGQTWNEVRRLIAAGRVRIGGETCCDPARRVHGGDLVELLPRPSPQPHQHETVVIRYLDSHVVVVEKPAGMCSVRHPTERDWPARRKRLHPALEDMLPALIARKEGRPRKGVLPRVRVVQRLDKETSGLIVFARTVTAEQSLGRQMRTHRVVRKYVAIAAGSVLAQQVCTRLVRDRGDGRRGSTTHRELGKKAITHFEVLEQLPGYTLLSCRLETGRTHQIRIHLAELGHPICGEKVYNVRMNDDIIPDQSGAPRLALHAAELGFAHPATEEFLQWTMDLPPDLQTFLEHLRANSACPPLNP